MKNFINRALSAAMLSSIACSAMAANENIDIKVIGEIVPAACIPAVTGGGVFDYGSMSASKIAADDFTVLNKLTKNFTITCDAAVKVAIRTTDARNASRVIMPGVTLLDNFNANADDTFGLGEAGGKKIGAYAMQLINVQLDGRSDAVQHMFKISGSSSWVGWTKNPLTSHAPDVLHSWSDPGQKTPKAFKTLSGDLEVQAAINKGSELDLSQKVTLDGLGNIEIVYL